MPEFAVSGSGCGPTADLYATSVAISSGTALDAYKFSWSSSENGNRNVQWSALTTDTSYESTYTVTVKAFAGCSAQSVSYTV